MTQVVLNFKSTTEAAEFFQSLKEHKGQTTPSAQTLEIIGTGALAADEIIFINED